MTEVTANGTERETRDRNANPSGWTNQQKNEVKPAPKRTFRSGKSKCKARINLAAQCLVQKRVAMQEDSLLWKNPSWTRH
jgi:hypothetical protein